MFQHIQNFVKDVFEGVCIGTLLCAAHTVRNSHTKYFMRNLLIFIPGTLFLLHISKSKKNRQFKLIKAGLSVISNSPQSIYLDPRPAVEWRPGINGEYYWHFVHYDY